MTMMLVGWRRVVLTIGLLCAALFLWVLPAQAAGPGATQYAAQVEPICIQKAQANARILSGVRKKIRAHSYQVAGQKISKASALLGQAIARLDGIFTKDQQMALLSDQEQSQLSAWLNKLRAIQSLMERAGTKISDKQLRQAVLLETKAMHWNNRATMQALTLGLDSCILREHQFIS